MAAACTGARGADLEMARIPGGRFVMGSSEEELRREFPAASPGMWRMLLAEAPAREVDVAPFRMDRYEVTNARFARFVRANPEWGKGAQFREGEEDLPVTFVTWAAAAAFAAWEGKRLPTEAEWEWAAAGGLARPQYPWGDAEPSARRVNFSGSGLARPVRVGSYTANGYGLFDMAGNVWEFCADAWPAGPDGANRRVIRGGSFGGGAFNLRVRSRDSHREEDPVGHVGFRCVEGGS
jgi:formylglycine-generating enzyme required for sulfatase activity